MTVTSWMQPARRTQTAVGPRGTCGQSDRPSGEYCRLRDPYEAGGGARDLHADLGELPGLELRIDRHEARERDLVGLQHDLALRADGQVDARQRCQAVVLAKVDGQRRWQGPEV